jgi:tripartite-type tricarboxylate transporter receptor subunit TctC
MEMYMNIAYRWLMASLMILLCGVSSAQSNWPSKTITLIAPTLPGSDGDTIVRAVAQKMNLLMNSSVIVENKAGAGGTLGVAIAANGSPDGHLAVITGTGPFILYPLLSKKPQYDMEKSFEPVSLMSTFASVVIVSPDSPYKSLKDLIAYAKAHPGKLTFGSSGQSTLVHLQGELLKIQENIDLLHVPYKSQTPAIQAVMTQEVTMMILPSASAQSLIQSGKLRALAQTSDARMKTLPDVPTMSEAGVKDFVVKGWYGAYAPTGTPKALTQRLSAEMRRALLSPEVVERFNMLGMDAVGGSPDQLYAAWKSDTAIWTKVLKANPQIKLDE